MEIRYEAVMFLLMWTVFVVVVAVMVSTSCTNSQWERTAIRYRVATYSEDTGKFQWIKPCENIREVEGK